MERPLITTAEGLVPHLSGVERDPFGQYEFVADPPCHASQSGRSFQFGDTPGGGVALGCWSPGCQGPGFVRRIEDRLGGADSDPGIGRGADALGRHRDFGWIAGTADGAAGPAEVPVPGAGPAGGSRARGACDGAGRGVPGQGPDGPAGLVPRWRPRRAYRWNYRGQRKGFAHSEKAEHGGVSLARNGGVLRKRGQAPVELKAWRTHRELSEQMERAADTLRAALSQAGGCGQPVPSRRDGDRPGRPLQTYPERRAGGMR